MKRFHVITLFPEAIEAFAGSSMLKRAAAKKLLAVKAINPRDFTIDKHHTVDGRSYGGGPGMVMKAEPVLKAVEAALRKSKKASAAKKLRSCIFIMSPRGKQFTAHEAARFARRYDDIVLIAGHYEGIDARVKKILKAREISTGPYVLTGGELPALTVIDAVARHIPGVLGKEESLEEKRTAAGELYTRPEVLKYKKKRYQVPKVLLSGNHADIQKWRQNKA